MNVKKILFIFILFNCCNIFFAKELDDSRIKMCPIPGTNYQFSSTEVTQELFKKVTGENPSEYKNPNFPVERVSYYDVIFFCNKLSVLTCFIK